MWRVGQDATLRMTVGALILLDRPPTTKALEERLALVADHVPRLRKRPDDPTAMRTRPAWVDDPDPVPANHFRSLSVAEPGSLRQALDLIALLESIPFDPERSPWDVTLIEGLENGRGALYLRAHHALTDGLGGARLLGQLLDDHEWPSAAPTATEEEWPIERKPSADGDRKPGTMTITVDAPRVVRRLLEGVNAARDVDLVQSAVRGVQRALDVANSVSRQMMVTGGPLSSRPATRSLLSHFEVFSVDGARAASLALGGSRNDLLVAAAANGLGRYHDKLGQPTSELRLATPTSRRGEHETGGNWFAPARLEVPTSVGPAGATVWCGGGAAGAGPPRARAAGRVDVGGDARAPADTAAPPGAARSSRLRRLRRDCAPGLPRDTQHLRVAHRSELSTRPPAGLPDEHHGVRQRRPPRRGHRS